MVAAGDRCYLEWEHALGKRQYTCIEEAGEVAGVLTCCEIDIIKVAD